ncbi:deoxyribose-phosphate aldolase [Chloracidobacterium thermophilum]|uniref:deoxyribose-phosphate aldolase n=1 Tax=Chloracidobacterium thermophilum TaxID=458033 RepID=UPI0007388AD3|nr:deoxyribose-phosphate aldolase [Chloracidobacterium thermophilum]
MSLASLIDHTWLKPEATKADITRLCHEAQTHGFAAVCVNPIWVSHAARILAGCGTAVCTVIGFPLGATTTEVKVYEARQALENGAREIDMVMAVGQLKDRDFSFVEADIQSVVNLTHQYKALCKVIIEAALLTDDEKVQACAIIQAAGADFVKTSTGFSQGGATVRDVVLLRQSVGPAIGVKASGGIRSRETAEQLIAAGATRIGTSNGIAILQDRQVSSTY